MGEALLGGLLDASWAAPREIAVVEPAAARRDELTPAYPGVRIQGEPTAADAAVLAVKPGDVEAACAQLGELGAGCPRRVLSIAAGVRIARLGDALPTGTVVLRAMPNTPALVRAGAATLAGGPTATDDDLAWAESVLGAVGTVVRVPEPALDAVTGLSGSGPAYVFLLAEALIDAGVLVGLTRDTSRALAVQTLLGSARLLAESGDAPEVLRAAVTSPGGTTAAGLRALEHHGVRAAVLDAVEAATARARALGGD